MTVFVESGALDLPGRVTGKVAVVTGAGQVDGPGIGNGKATALTLAREGARLVLVDRQPERAEITQKEIQAAGREAIVVAADVTDQDDCERITRSTLDAYGQLDILVNNVGLSTAGGVVDMAPETWHQMIDVNLTSIYLVSKYAIPAMIDNGGGTVINISSIAALRAIGFAAYAAAKGGMISLTQEMAVAYGPEGVRINVVVPGTIQTPRTLSSTGQVGMTVEEMARRASAALPLGAVTRGTAWDIAYAVLFFASTESSWVTGQILTVDGGACSVYPELAVRAAETRTT